MFSSHTSDLPGESRKNPEPAPASEAIAGEGDDDGRTAGAADEAPPALEVATLAAGNRAREGRERGTISPWELEPERRSGEGRRVDRGAISDCRGIGGRSVFMAKWGGEDCEVGEKYQRFGIKPRVVAKRGGRRANGGRSGAEFKSEATEDSLALRNVARIRYGRSVLHALDIRISPI